MIVRKFSAEYNRLMAKKEPFRHHDKFLPVRISQQLLDVLRRAAKNDNRSLSNWVRDRLQKAAKRELKK